MSMSNSLFSLQPDLRTSGWFMIGSPTWLTVLTSIYLLVFGLLVPAYPDFAPSLNIDAYTFSLFTSITLSFSNWVLTFAFLWYEVKLGYNPVCQKVGISGEDEKMVATLLHFYMLIKMWEWWDTFWYAVRARFMPTYNLHIFHHSTMVVIGWLAVRYAPGGSSAVMALLNTFAHASMYTYFLLRKLKLIDAMDLEMYHMSHFIAICLAALSALWKNCGYPRDACVVLALYVFGIMIIYGWNTFRPDIGGGGDGGGGGGDSGGGGGGPSGPNNSFLPPSVFINYGGVRRRADGGMSRPFP